MSITDATHCYIGTKACGCTVAAVVDIPRLSKETAKSVAEFIKDGLIIERVLIADAKVALKSCKCNSKPVEQTLW